MQKRTLIILGAVVIIAGLVYYRGSLSSMMASSSQPAVTEPISRELTAEAKYEAPSGTDHVRFTLVVDENGLVQSAKSVNLEDPGNVHQIEFSKNLTVMIKGKKLSEIGQVDKVGTASLTTSAFNASLPSLKAQL